MAEQTVLGNNIKKRLEALGKSPAWLAGVTHLTRGGISKIISGKTRTPDSSTVASIAHALKVSSEFLYGETGNPERADSPPLPEYAMTVIERMREMDEVQNYTLRLIADTMLEYRQHLRHQSLLLVINWVSEESGLGEEGEALQSALRGFERRIARRISGQAGDQPPKQD